MSSPLPMNPEPAASRTPTTRKLALPRVTVAPTAAFGSPNAVVAVFAPRTTTAARSSYSAAVKNDPAARVRPWTLAQFGVDASMVTFATASPKRSSRPFWITGATPMMSGAAAGSDRASASAIDRGVMSEGS